MYYITRAEVGAPLRPSCRLPCALRFNGCENNFVSAPNGSLRLLGGNAGSGCRSAKANGPAAGHRHSKDATSHRLPQLRIFHKIPVVFCNLLKKQKPKKTLALDAKCLWRDIDVMAVSKSLSKLSDFQPVTASPYRVLHQVQGDKQEINLSCCNHNGAQNAVHT